MIVFLCITFLLTAIVSCDEVITLENKTHFLCLTDNQESAIFVIPPVLENAKDTSLLLEDDKQWDDDWVLKNSTDVVVSEVVDKRWEDFELIQTNEIHYDSVMSLSFSVYRANAVNITVNDVNEVIPKRERDIFISWSHSSLHRTATNKPFQVTVKTDTNAFWKIHTYKLRWSETISQKPTSLVVSPSDASCLMLYMYVCSYCSLTVYTSGSVYMFHGKTGTSDRLEEWRSLKINVGLQNSITLVRNTTSGENNGQWGIDIRHCSITKSNKAVFKVDLGKNEAGKYRYCDTLAPQLSSSQGSIFECGVGSLGKNCTVKCEDFLGSENKNCEKYKICDSSSIVNTKCSCAWGYQGDSCEQSCTKGTWGLSCQNKCNKCKTCNGQSGEEPSDCGNGALSSHFSKGIGFILFLAISGALL